MKTITGNVTIENNICNNAVLEFSGDLTIDLSVLSQEFITGTGTIFITNIQNRGTVNLYNGSFEFNVVNSSLYERNNSFTVSNYLLKVALLNFDFNFIKVGCDNALIDGEIGMSEILTDNISDDIDFEVTNVNISKSLGIDFVGKLELEDIKLRKIIEVDKFLFDYNAIDNEFEIEADIEIIWLDFGFGGKLGNGKLEYLAVSSGFNPILTGISCFAFTEGGIEIGNLKC